MSIQHVNAISNRLSLRPPQRESLEILARICEIITLESLGRGFITADETLTKLGEARIFKRPVCDVGQESVIPPQSRIPAGGSDEVVVDSSGEAPAHTDCRADRYDPQIRYDREKVEGHPRNRQHRQRDGQPLQAPPGQ